MRETADSLWAMLFLCVTLCGLVFMGLKPDSISRLSEEYEEGLMVSTQAARSARMTFEDTGHRPSARKVDDLTKLGWIDREDDHLGRRLQEQEDGDWSGRTRVLPAAVTDPTGVCVGTTACGVVRDGAACVDVCTAARWTPAEMPPLGSADAVMAAALDLHLRAVHLSDRCPTAALGPDNAGFVEDSGAGDSDAAGTAAFALSASAAAQSGEDGGGHGAGAERGAGPGAGLGFISYHALSRGSFGAQLLHSARGLARATAFNRTLIAGRLSLRPWTSSKRCGMQRNLLCYLEPFTSCLLDLHDSAGRHAAAAMAPVAADSWDVHDTPSQKAGGGDGGGRAVGTLNPKILTLHPKP